MHIDAPPGYLVVDGSLWNDHVNIQQLLDGGVVSVIMGMYQQWDVNKYILNTDCERILDQIVTDGRLILQSYFYYYPETDPINKANWWIDTIAAKGYPVAWAWADCEAYKAVLDLRLRSEQNRRFCVQMQSRFPKSGVYTGKWYIDAYAPEMDLWLPGHYNWIPHYGRQPKVATAMTWAQLKAGWLPNYDITISPGQLAGNIVGHQFTGDVCKVPGFYDYANQVQACDVSIFTKEFIDSLRVESVPAPTICPCCGQPIHGVPPAPLPPVIPANIYYVKDGYNINVHYPNFNSPSLGLLLSGTKIVADDDTSNPYWVHFTPTNLFHNGGWVYKPYLRR